MQFYTIYFLGNYVDIEKHDDRGFFFLSTEVIDPGRDEKRTWRRKEEAEKRLAFWFEGNVSIG